MADDKYLILISLIFVVFVPLFLLKHWLSSLSLKKYAQIELLSNLNKQVSLIRKVFKASLLLLAFAFIVIALCRPHWNPKPKQIKRHGRDVAVLLDVSRSMLAEDVKPSRLERAKLAIKDVIEHLKGDRVALITFAGRSVVKCPLTQDYAFLRLVLDDIDTESAGRGGTNLGDAIRKTANEVFDNTIKEYKDIILISDGGDLEKSLPLEAARDAADKGIRIIAVGLGDKENGGRIPVYNNSGSKTFLMYDNTEVWSKLESKTLRDCALSSKDGKYIPAGTNAFELGKIYDDLVAGAQKRELEATTNMEYEEKFQIFIGFAIILLIAELFTSEKKTVKA